jgi:Fe-S cluster assembly protein SufD
LKGRFDMETARENIRWYQTSFEQLEKQLNGERSAEVHALRRAAIQMLPEIGFPTPKQEEWRFTNVSPIAKTEFQLALEYVAPHLSLADIKPYVLDDAIRLVFIDGWYSPEFSDTRLLPGGVAARNLAEELKNNPATADRFLNRYVKPGENAFTALNAAFVRDGAFVSVPARTVLEVPVQVLHISTDRESALASHPRNIIVVGEGSRASLIETYYSAGRNNGLTNAVTEIEIRAGAIVEYNKLQAESDNAYHINTTAVHQAAGSVFTSNTFVLGGAIVRNNLTSVLGGEGCECTLNGLSLGAGKQLIDNHTVIDHSVPHCNSHELYKAILDGASRGVFNGKIFVRKDAQKTDSKQTNKTLLLSDGATINAKPQLEIFADDVKCTHGATVGQLDEEQVFYLRSRGIDEKQARDILTLAFAGDIVGRIELKQLRSQWETLIRSRLDLNRKADESR